MDTRIKLERIKLSENNTLVVPDGKAGIFPFYVYDRDIYVMTNDIIDGGDNDFLMFKHNFFISSTEEVCVYRKGEVPVKSKIDCALFLSVDTDTL
jgi:hypothetical protein